MSYIWQKNKLKIRRIKKETVINTWVLLQYLWNVEGKGHDSSFQERDSYTYTFRLL